MCTCGCQLAISAELAKISAAAAQGEAGVSSTAGVAAVASAAKSSETDSADLRASGCRVANLLSLIKTWFITHSIYARAAR